jgi:hypothetical protein
MEIYFPNEIISNSKYTPSVMYEYNGICNNIIWYVSDKCDDSHRELFIYTLCGCVLYGSVKDEWNIQ